jgi:hypothetical protein
MPPILAFYELALRVYFPRLPSLFAMAVKLSQRRILTVETIIWLASSLPTNFLGELGPLGGVAMQATAAMVGGAASLNNALVGNATGFLENASKTVAQGIGHLKPGVVATEITHVLSDGSRITADQATSITHLVKNGETAVIDNISHLISSEPAISPGQLVPDIAKNAVHTMVDNTSAVTNTVTGATKAAVTENTAKLAHVLDSVNPLHIMSTGSQSKGAQAQVCVILLCMPLCHGCSELSAETVVIGKQAISASESLAPHNASGDIQAVVGTAHVVVHSATKPLGMGLDASVRFLRSRIM